jgi:hypothetical protein
MQCGEVDELCAEGVDGFVEQVVEFDSGAQAQAFAEAKLAREIEIESEESGAASGVARKVAGAPDDGQREGCDESRIERFAGTARADRLKIAVEDGAVVADIIEIAVSAAERKVERRARSKTQDRGEA